MTGVNGFKQMFADMDVGALVCKRAPRVHKAPKPQQAPQSPVVKVLPTPSPLVRSTPTIPAAMPNRGENVPQFDFSKSALAVAVGRMYLQFGKILEQKSLQNVSTPFALCLEILSKLEIMPEKKYLVVSAIEFIVVLIDVFKVPKENIFFLDENRTDGTIGSSVKSLIVRQVFGFGTEQVLSERDVVMKKFDFVVGNPPYLKRGWKSFLELMIRQSNSYVACICPDPTANMTDFGASVRELLSKAGIQSITECTNAFGGVESGKISYFICDKNAPTKPEVFSMGNDVRTRIKEKIISYGDSLEKAFFCRGSQASITCDKQKTAIGENNVPCILSVTNTGMEIVYVRQNDFPKRTKNKDKFHGRFLAINRFFGKNPEDPIYEIDDITNSLIGYNVIVFKIEKDETLESFRSLYCSKLYKWMMHVLRNGTFDITQSNLMLLPRLDLTKVWTDDELYSFFGLDEDEIEYIKSFEMP